MGRSPCCDKDRLKKGPWTQEEDAKLTQYIQTHGPGNWRTLPKNAGLQRCGKSCRLRWTNYLRPDIKRGRFSFEEEDTIIQLHSVLGNKWSAIAARLPGRTDNEIKNYWNTHIRKRLLQMGLDPLTHAPRLDLMDVSSIINSAQLHQLSNFLGLQALLNPDLIRLATLLASSSDQLNRDLFSNIQAIAQTMNQNPNTVTNLVNQANFMQKNNDQYFSENMVNIHTQIPEDDVLPKTSSLNPNPASVPDYNRGFDQLRTSADVSENLSFHPSRINGSSNINNRGRDFSFDSVLSTPILSPTQLNSSSTFVNSNSSSTEDERESCSSDDMFMKFEIPESLDFDDFM